MMVIMVVVNDIHILTPLLFGSYLPRYTRALYRLPKYVHRYCSNYRFTPGRLVVPFLLLVA